MTSKFPGGINPEDGEPITIFDHLSEKKFTRENLKQFILNFTHTEWEDDIDFVVDRLIEAGWIALDEES